MAKVYKTGDKVQVISNDYVPGYEGRFHYYEIGETVRVVRVAQNKNAIYCINSKGLEQVLRPTHIKLIKRYKKEIKKL